MSSTMQALGEKRSDAGAVEAGTSYWMGYIITITTGRVYSSLHGRLDQTIKLSFCSSFSHVHFFPPCHLSNPPQSLLQLFRHAYLTYVHPFALLLKHTSPP